MAAAAGPLTNNASDGIGRPKTMGPKRKFSDTSTILSV